MNIGRILLPIILFFFVVIEGVALKLLPESLLYGQIVIIPHWVFALLVLSVLLFDKDNTHYSIWYAGIFGLLIDIVYTDLLGVYMFCYASVIYLLHELKQRMHENMFTTTILGLFAFWVVDILIHFIYFVLGKASLGWGAYFVQRMLATGLGNVIFLILLYLILAKRLKLWQVEAGHDEF